MPLIITVIVVGVLASGYFKRNEPVKAEQAITNITKPPVFDKLEWPEDQPIGQSSEMAFASLLSQWNVAPESRDGSAPCEAAQTHGLQCLDDIGSLNSLRQLNIPAVLKLSNEKNDIFYATLTALKKDTAIVQVGTTMAETR